MPEYNYPEPSDPDFNKKVIDLLRQVFDKQESDIQSFNPINSPDQTKDGQMFYDGTTNRLKFVTPAGVKTLTFDP